MGDTLEVSAVENRILRSLIIIKLIGIKTVCSIYCDVS